MARTITSFTTRVGATPVKINTVDIPLSSMLLGCIATNLQETIIPIDLYIRRGGTDTYITKNRRPDIGVSIDLVVGKIHLFPGDELYASTNVDNGYDLLTTIVLGV